MRLTSFAQRAVDFGMSIEVVGRGTELQAPSPSYALRLWTPRMRSHCRARDLSLARDRSFRTAVARIAGLIGSSWRSVESREIRTQPANLAPPIGINHLDSGAVNRYVAVCGASDPRPDQRELAREVGRRLAESGVIVLCGGLGGVMEAVAEGAASAGGMVVGILPGADRTAANPYLTLAIATGLGEARNAVLTTAADAVIAIGGGWGTLSEIALARKRDRPVVVLASWELEGVPVALSAEAAVRAAIGR